MNRLLPAPILTAAGVAVGLGLMTPARADVTQQTDTQPATTLPTDVTPGTPPNPPPMAPPADAPPKPDWLKALTEGTLDLSLRGRYEYADIAGLDSANAVTLRTRLGYTTQRLGGFQAAVQLEDNRAADYDEYNAAGLNGQGGTSIVADPEDTELNQLWIDLDLVDFFSLDTQAKASARIGRQRIILDDARFVGNVGWRQLEQTFDAATLKLQPSDGLELFYGYINAVNRIFGPDSGRDFDSNSHLINATIKNTPVGAITGFAYLLDFENGAALSSQTYGGRLSKDFDLDEGLKLGLVGSVAHQSDYADNPTGYDALYVLAEGRLTTAGGLFGGVGFESLGSDDGVAAFQTPLATAHAFNGFADVFLTTPAGGLRDYYGLVGTKLPAPFKGKLVATYHQFTSEDSSEDLGWELDLVASHQFNPNLTGLVKYAYFDGDGLPDVERLWVQLELSF